MSNNYIKGKLVPTILVIVGVVACIAITTWIVFASIPKGYIATNKPVKTATSPTPAQTQIVTTTPTVPYLSLLNQAGSGLLDIHTTMIADSWAWQSVIQSPHFQTDRDVGTASVGMGLLALWQTTHNDTYLSAAKSAGNWLLAAAVPQNGGLSWPDYADPGNTSDDFFTSFDDGTPGIADFFWRLYEASGDLIYKNAAIDGMQWEMSQAQDVGSAKCPSVECRWVWSNNSSKYEIGMGEGQAGIALAFDTFAQRTGNPVYEAYARASAAYVHTLITPQGAIPEVAGDTAYDTGFLSGASGDAFMYLTLYAHTHEASYLTDANTLLNWVYSQKEIDQNGISWPIMIDPVNGDNSTKATGIEEGSAGIGWVALQAYSVTGDIKHLEIAKSAASWLESTGIQEGNGMSWEEDANQRKQLTHTGLDNGVAGIGWFFHDMMLATNDISYDQYAINALHWLQNNAHKTTNGLSWDENRSKDKSGQIRWNLPNEPSWHWGDAGISAFIARMNGWSTDMPGEESGI